jgi:hypothetical protein
MSTWKRVQNPTLMLIVRIERPLLPAHVSKSNRTQSKQDLFTPRHVKNLKHSQKQLRLKHEEQRRTVLSKKREQKSLTRPWTLIPHRPLP